jgi:phage gp36-like protein
MAYATQAQMQLAAGGEERFLALTDWDGDGAIDAPVVAEAQKRADGWIDGYLRLRYATPLTTPSETIIRLAADEAVYWLRKSRTMVGPEDATARKEREVEMEMMRDGKLRPDEPSPVKSTAVKSVIVENTSAMSRCNLKGIW